MRFEQSVLLGIILVLTVKYNADYLIRSLYHYLYSAAPVLLLMEFTMEFTAEDDVMKEIQVMHSTCSVLCEVFGFSMARAREAVNAISDKSDVELAWNWLLDHGEEDGGGPVVPTQM